MATPVGAGALRRTLLAGAALAAIGGGAIAAQDAQAAFTLRQCSGSAAAGRGASFQNALHLNLRTWFESSRGLCRGAAPGPSYTSTGSGDGKVALGVGGRLRDGTALDKGVRFASVSFAAADEAPTPAEKRSMEDGPTAATGDDGKLRTIPVATGASVLIMHAPEGCTLTTVTNRTNGADNAVGNTRDSADNLTSRIRVDGRTLEAAFAGRVTTWGELAPGISGTASGITGGDQTNAGRSCETRPVRRIVRTDRSGTTYGWKTYLHTLNPSAGWIGRWASDNREWPNAAGNTATIVTGQGADCNGADLICRPTGEGGSSITSAVAATDGSISYVDLATSRGTFSITPDATRARQDYTFFSPLEVVAGADRGKYAEPTFNADEHLSTTSTRGASCEFAAIVNAPGATGADASLADWSGAYAAGGNGYPACVLTYIMAWDDNAPVYGNTPAEESKARTVKDYLTQLVGNDGQNRMLTADYSPLPAAIQAQAIAGVDAIDWNKSAVVTPPPDEPRPPVVTPPVVTPPVVTPPVVTPPSNAFSVPSSRASASALTFSVQLPGAGSLQAVATARVGRRTIRVASVSASPRAAGRVTLTLRLSSAAKRALARAKNKRLAVSVAFTFTPTGGTANTVNRTVTVRAAARRAARRGSRRGGRRGGRRSGRKNNKKAAKR